MREAEEAENEAHERMEERKRAKSKHTTLIEYLFYFLILHIYLYFFPLLHIFSLSPAQARFPFHSAIYQQQQQQYFSLNINGTHYTSFSLSLL
jgi:hypothetical protein